MRGPILRAECEPRTSRSPGFAHYLCLAVTADIPATALSPAGLQGHPYQVRLNVASGRYAFCKIAPAAGKALRALQPRIRVPRECGGT